MLECWKNWIFETLREGAGWGLESIGVLMLGVLSAQDPSQMSIYIGEINVDIYHKYDIDIYYNILPQLSGR